MTQYIKNIKNVQDMQDIQDIQGIQLTNRDKLRIVCAGLIGGTVGSFISLLLHYYIATTGLIPGF